MESHSMPDAEINFMKTKKGPGAVFMVKEIENHDEEIKIDEKVLCNDNYSDSIIFATERNDIKSLTKVELARMSKNISSGAVNKLSERRRSQLKVERISFDKNKLLKNLVKQVSKLN